MHNKLNFATTLFHIFILSVLIGFPGAWSYADTPTPVPTNTPTPTYTPTPPLIANITLPGWQRTPVIQVGWTVTGSNNPNGIKAVKLTRTNQQLTPTVLMNNTYTQAQSTSSVSGTYTDNLPNVTALYSYDLEASDYLNRSDWDFSSAGVDVDPPSVNILSPANNSFSSHKTISVEINASDIGAGLDYVYVYCNGSLVSTKSFSYPTTPQRFSVSVDLSPGANAISAQALDGAGWSTNNSGINVTYEPPKFISAEVNPVQIIALGELINFAYKINYDGQIRISISDAAGNEYGAITNPEWITYSKNPEPTATPYVTTFNGSAIINGQFQLLENGQYHLKAEYRSNDGEYYEDPATLKKYYLSSELTLDIHRTTVTAAAYTSSNASGYRIQVPDVTFSFISQVTNAVGVVISRNSSGNYSVPTQGSFQAKAEKDGYKTAISPELFNPANTQEFIVNDFNPYRPIPEEMTMYKTNIDSDGDGMSDGWEYKYWINWQGWTPTCGCDLSRPDGANDPDADGVQNLEEYRLQGKGFPDLDPHVRDLCVELDWVKWVGSTTRNYEPDNNAKETCKLIFREAGVTVHYAVSPQSNEILRNDNLPNEPEVNLVQLRQMLRDSQWDYGDANTDGDIDVVHAIFAPGWTVIRDLTQTGNTSTGGLYLKNPGGIFVFDLHTRNVVAGRVEEDTTHSPLLGNYEGNILAHELGHVLGLQDRGE